MRHQIYDEENLDLQDDENTEIYIGPTMNEQDEEDNDYPYSVLQNQFCGQPSGKQSEHFSSSLKA